MYQDSMPGAPARIPAEPPEAQPTGLYLVNLPPITYPYPAPTLFNHQCPYQAQYIVDNGQFSSQLSQQVADDLRSKQVAVIPTYPQIWTVLAPVADQQILLPILPVDSMDFAPPRDFADGKAPLTQPGTVDQQPRTPIQLTSVAREAYATADASAILPTAATDGDPRCAAPAQDYVPTRVAECR